MVKRLKVQFIIKPAEGHLGSGLRSFFAPPKRRTGFGLFYTAFGVAWLLGSAAMGLLYDKSLFTLIMFSVAFQLVALPVLIWGRSASQKLPS